MSQWPIWRPVLRVRESERGESLLTVKLNCQVSVFFSLAFGETPNALRRQHVRNCIIKRERPVPCHGRLSGITESDRVWVSFASSVWPLRCVGFRNGIGWFVVGGGLCATRVGSRILLSSFYQGIREILPTSRVVVVTDRNERGKTQMRTASTSWPQLRIRDSRS